MRSRIVLAALLLPLAAVSVPAQETPQLQIANWPAPPFWTPSPSARTLDDARGRIESTQAAAALSSPVPFFAVTPCRIVDTRGPNGTFGGPIIAAGTSRDFPLASNPAYPGIPVTAAAYSLNFTTTQSVGGGALTVYPTGGVFPLVSTMNFEAGRSIANAVVAPAGTGGSIRVFAGTNATHVIIDVNGYYASSAVGSTNTFLGPEAGNSAMTGDGNTGIGWVALSRNTTGSSNTAVGLSALQDNTSGIDNVGIGLAAGVSNQTGSNNIFVGSFAGANISTGSYNIDIGNRGFMDESNTIRIGDSNQTSAITSLRSIRRVLRSTA